MHIGPIFRFHFIDCYHSELPEVMTSYNQRKTQECSEFLQREIGVVSLWSIQAKRHKKNLPLYLFLFGEKYKPAVDFLTTQRYLKTSHLSLKTFQRITFKYDLFNGTWKLTHQNIQRHIINTQHADKLSTGLSLMLLTLNLAFWLEDFRSSTKLESIH